MKTFTTALLVIALSSMALAVDNCTPGKCVTCAYNTAESKNYCTQCHATGFSAEWDNSSCSGDLGIDNCEAIEFDGETTDTKCAICKEGYTENEDGGCEVEELPDNCLFGSSSTVCFYCDSGYYLTGDSDCEAVTTTVANCKNYSDATTCSSCEDGYWLEDGACEEGEIENCATYSTEESCMFCMGGYYLDDNTCVLGSISNCYTYEPLDTDSCNTCEEGYHANTDGSKCLATEGCGSPIFSSGDDYDCYQCDIGNGYYAVDVDGTTQVDNGSNDFWAQVCEKNAAIQTILFLSLSVVALF